MTKNKNASKILYCYLAESIVLLTISLFNPLGLYKVSGYTYILIILCIASFVISIVYLSNKNLKTKSDEKEIQKKIERSLDKLLKSKILTGIVITNLVIVIFYKIKYNYIIQTLPKQEIRMARFNALFNTPIEAIFFNYIISGTIYFFCVLLAIVLVNKKFKNLIFPFLILNIVIYSLIGYGRITIFKLLIYFFILIILKPNRKSFLNIKNVIKTFILVISALIIFTGMMYMRIKKDNISIKENIQKTVKEQTCQIFEYLVGGYRLLDNFIKNGFEEFPTYTYGRATFAGIEEIILYPLKGIGLEINSFNNTISKYTQERIKIGNQDSYGNAYYTCIMNFYLDFGILGVIIFPVLHSMLIIYCLKIYEKKKNIYSLILLNYVLLNLFFSFLRWNYQSGTTVFVLIILILLNNFQKEKFVNIRKEESNENIMDCK